MKWIGREGREWAPQARGTSGYRPPMAERQRRRRQRRERSNRPHRKPDRKPGMKQGTKGRRSLVSHIARKLWSSLRKLLSRRRREAKADRKQPRSRKPKPKA